MKETVEDHSLYKVGYWEIFSKNFLVGFARGIGGLAVQLVFLLIAYYSFVTFVLPKIQPFMNTIISAQESLGKLQNPGSMFGDSNSIELETPKKTR